ncbi:hypothetical protein FRC96_05425 [Lujinxingia vulgaris]|uniref:Glycosyltransferase RgtA/B/C/D-like domain-containing protein n=1 Tax=Lujinxingia vulgaris TaxID=2600176 RepID=A0A5C6XJY6_9DELT|nr:hypothetical protein [Lujinxingia vulgaris]TXD40687.1 hypothetical protein FRC96_05425 [Lujinxingia vulgaris]
MSDAKSPTTPPASTSDRRPWIMIALVLLCMGYAWLFLDVSAPNERTRIYLTWAMLHEGTLAIDVPMERFGRVFDLAAFEGQHFTDKAPGLSFLALPVYAIAMLFGAGDWEFESLLMLFRLGVMLPLAALGMVALRGILQRLQVSPGSIELATVAWMLGSAAFHYAGAFFGHHAVAVALLVALWQLEILQGGGTESGVSKPGGGMLAFGAGLAAGVAGLIEFQAGVACLLLSAYVVFEPRLRRWPIWLGFGLGALGPLILLLVYNNAAFGGPLELSYHHLVNDHLNDLHTQGVGGVTLPKWEYFSGIALSMHRGLLPSSPWVLLAIPGAVALFRRRPALSLLLSATALAYLAVVSSANMWFAGWGFGPRLLVPSLGAWAILSAVGFAVCRRHVGGRILTLTLVAWGVIYCQLVAATMPELPPKFKNPLPDIVVPLLREGFMSENVLSLSLGTASMWTMFPIFIALLAAMLMAARCWQQELVWQKALATTTLAIVIAAGSAWGVSQMKPGVSKNDQQKFVRLVERWRDAGMDS